MQIEWMEQIIILVFAFASSAIVRTAWAFAQMRKINRYLDNQFAKADLLRFAYGKNVRELTESEMDEIYETTLKFWNWGTPDFREIYRFENGKHVFGSKK